MLSIFCSFVTVTFVIEAMASANAIVIWRRVQQRKRVGLLQDSLFNESESEVFHFCHISGC